MLLRRRELLGGNNGIIILDYEKGIDRTNGFTAPTPVKGTSSVTKTNGYYLLQTSGGSNSGGSDNSINCNFNFSKYEGYSIHILYSIPSSNYNTDLFISNENPSGNLYSASKYVLRRHGDSATVTMQTISSILNQTYTANKTFGVTFCTIGGTTQVIIYKIWLEKETQQITFPFFSDTKKLMSDRNFEKTLMYLGPSATSTYGHLLQFGIQSHNYGDTYLTILGYISGVSSQVRTNYQYVTFANQLYIPENATNFCVYFGRDGSYATKVYFKVEIGNLSQQFDMTVYADTYTFPSGANEYININVSSLRGTNQTLKMTVWENEDTGRGVHIGRMYFR